MRRALNKFRSNKILLVKYDFSSNTPATFVNAQTTDYYRKGKPYKLLHVPSRSKVTIPIPLGPSNIPNGYSFDAITSIEIILNHCRTAQNAIVDIWINETEVIHAYNNAPHGFHEQTFSYPIENFVRGDNKMVIVLNAHSPAVYWLSDARFILHIDLNKV